MKLLLDEMYSPALAEALGAAGIDSVTVSSLGLALRKLIQLEAAERVEDLRVPPGNRLEKLKGDRAGSYSVRINEQWRIVFRFENGDALDVKIEDYH